MTATATADPRWARGPLRPLRAVPYRWLALTLAAELAGAGAWLIAVVWQVMALGGGAGDLGLVATAESVGVLIAVLLGGVAADRLPLRAIMMAVFIVRFAGAALVATAALTGSISVPFLAAVALARGLANGCYFPAYTALLPRIVPAADLHAANGLERILSTIFVSVVGPAIAGVVVALAGPGWAFVAIVLIEVIGLLALGALGAVPDRASDSGPDSSPDRPRQSAWADLREGAVYVIHTPWILGTLLFASVLVLLVLGPFEVLVPYALKEQAGGDSRDHAWVMAAYGLGGLLAAWWIASRPMPRRYHTIMILGWGVGSLPLAFVGGLTHTVTIAAAMFMLGIGWSIAGVLWGTLLQRRVPTELLGRVSSLDFFVSLIFLPLSMSLAAVVAEAIGRTETFVLAGLLPIPLAFATLWLARMRADELAHPLGDEPDESVVAAGEIAAQQQHTDPDGQDDSVAEVQAVGVGELDQHRPR